MTATPPWVLDPDEPSPVRVIRENGQSDFVLTADHAGRLIPRALNGLGVPPAEMDRHIAWDIGIAGVTERLSELLDAPAVFQAYSRLAIDCNREPAWPSAIPEISEFTEIPGNRGLTAADRGARVNAIFRPYHDRISDILDRRAAAGRTTIFVAMHSFTPVFKGEPRAIEAGVLYYRRTNLAGIMLDLLREEGDLTVGDNAPYAITGDSDYSIPRHGEGRGLEHVEIEIRQDLIATPDGQAAWAARFARLFATARTRL